MVLVPSVGTGGSGVGMRYLSSYCGRGIQRNDTNDREGIKVISR